MRGRLGHSGAKPIERIQKLKITDEKSAIKETHFVGPMTDRQWQRHVLRTARKNGWVGAVPSRLGTRAAESAFREAETFPLAKGILRDTK
jgi:hypothetical protein